MVIILYTYFILSEGMKKTYKITIIRYAKNRTIPKFNRKIVETVAQWILIPLTCKWDQLPFRHEKVKVYNQYFYLG
jgi:hypothetical protein